jgi:signal transduction histidine kinase
VQSEPINELQRLAAAFNNMIGQIARYRAGLRRYVAAITQSQEEERRRIARELHDDTIQSLVAISRRLELVQASLPDPRLAQQQVDALQGLVQDTIESVRRFSRELRPTLLEDLGLIPALRRLVRDPALDGAVSDVAITGSLGEVSPSVELALYRIAQEAIHNIAQHSQAHNVSVHLDMQSESIHLSVEDDGLGFAMPGGLSELAQRGNFGLMGIRERVELLGGHMDLRSEPGNGTRLQVWLPRSVEASD